MDRDNQPLEAIETKDLKKLHDSLYRALWSMAGLLAENGLQAPDWLAPAQSYTQSLYAELWQRRGGNDVNTTNPPAA